MKTYQINKIIIKTGRVDVFAIETDSSVEHEHSREISSKGNTRRPHPDFMKVLDALKVHAFRLSHGKEVLEGQDEDSLTHEIDRIGIKTVTCTHTEGIKFLRIDVTNKQPGGTVNISGLRVMLDETSPYEHVDDLISDWESIESHAILYLLNEEFNRETDPNQPELFQSQTEPEASTALF